MQLILVEKEDHKFQPDEILTVFSLLVLCGIVLINFSIHVPSVSDFVAFCTRIEIDRPEARLAVQTINIFLDGGNYDQDFALFLVSSFIAECYVIYSQIPEISRLTGCDCFLCFAIFLLKSSLVSLIEREHCLLFMRNMKVMC